MVVDEFVSGLAAPIQGRHRLSGLGEKGLDIGFITAVARAMEPVTELPDDVVAESLGVLGWISSAIAVEIEGFAFAAEGERASPAAHVPRIACTATAGPVRQDRSWL